MISLICMATAIFFEARGESLDGMLAVGQVIQNRVESEKFPDSVCEVVYQKHQFSFINDGKSDNIFDYSEPESWYWSIVAASEVISGKNDVLISSTYYHAASVKPYWSERFALDGRIGNHLFYSDVDIAS